MANPNKRKGDAFEVGVLKWLRDEAGLYVVRPRQEGLEDVGDLHVAGSWALQAKAWKDLAGALREGVDGAHAQRMNAGLPYGAAVIKRPRRPISEAYVVHRLADLPALILATEQR